MILQALNSYYNRLVEEPDIDIPRHGTSRENISFALVLLPNGSLVDVEDLRVQEGNKKHPRKVIVPAWPEKRSSGVKANFLWDTTAYVLGEDDKGKLERVQKCHQAFKEQIEKFCQHSGDPGLEAVLHFLSSDQGKDIRSREDWPEISGSNLAFRLDGVPGFIHDRPAAQAAWNECCTASSNNFPGQCLVEGTTQSLARLHPGIKGVQGGQSSGVSLVAFNKKSFESYGKKQSFNAPVGQRAAFAYATALNYLLARDSRQKVRIGEMTLVFWAERQNPAEAFLADLLEPPQEEVEEQHSEEVDDAATAVKIRDLLQAIRQGKQAIDIVPNLDPDVHFYLLGVSPNAARLSIRYWENDSLGNLLTRIGRHFSDISIVRQYDNEPEFPSLWRLLLQTAAMGKSENIPPVLSGGMARAMLSGANYPNTLLPVILGRIRADGIVNYFRASLLKGYLVRNRNMEVSMTLDTHRTNQAYVLGRLFAVLEKAQEDAIPNTGATIKDKYLASASATPGLVFHMLLKNSAHHLAKLRKDSEKKSWAYGYDQRIQEIMDKLDNFPRTLPAEDQGLFMIGYYHQRKDFFTKKNEEE